MTPPSDRPSPMRRPVRYGQAVWWNGRTYRVAALVTGTEETVLVADADRPGSTPVPAALWAQARWDARAKRWSLPRAE